MSLPRVDQASAMLDFVTRNREHLKRWNPPAPEGMYTLAHWHDMVARSAEAFDAGSGVRFWISLRDQPEHIIGSVGYSQIARGPFCSCVLGYQIDEQREGHGLMSEALRASNRYMFEERKLHRIAANYRPENVRNGRLLAKLGFRVEGFAKDYLFIDGAWRDHVLTSIVNDTFNQGWLHAK
jgi:ribosomal-protein-alanine N-acetyltransferase